MTALVLFLLCVCSSPALADDADTLPLFSDPNGAMEGPATPTTEGTTTPVTTPTTEGTTTPVTTPTTEGTTTPVTTPTTEGTTTPATTPTTEGTPAPEDATPLLQQTLTADAADAADGHRVTVSGMMPANTALSVVPLDADLVTEILRVYYNLPEGSEVPESFFAYDITLRNESDAVFQPEEFGVTVSVTVPEVPAAVSVVHVDTGNLSVSEPVSGTLTTEDVDLSALNETAVSAVAVDAVNEDAVEFTATSFSWYIGTITTGGELVLTPGLGYTFYNEDGATLLSGVQAVTENQPFTFQVRPSANYVIWNVSAKTNTGVPVEFTPGVDANGVYSVTVPGQSANTNVTVSVVAAVNATGGTIAASSTTDAVATIFNADTAQNVLVTGGSGTYTVTLNNNIQLNGNIAVDSGVTLTILSAGDYTIKRAFNAGNMFTVTGNMILGSGSVANDTITYTFKDGTFQNLPVTTKLSTDDLRNVTSTHVNARAVSTMTGTLTIDGGAILSGGYLSGDSSFPTNSGVAAAGSEIGSSHLIYVTGTMKMWGGVVIQNHYNNVGADAGKGTALLVKGTYYMYDGLITRCVASHGYDGSDGGALNCYGSAAKSYLYGGSITYCGAANSAACCAWQNSLISILHSVIEYCYSSGANNGNTTGQYHGNAVGGYQTGTIYQYGGSITKNTLWQVEVSPALACAFDAKITSGHYYLFDGTVGKLGVGGSSGHAYVYRGVINETDVVKDGNLDQIHYMDSSSKVTIPDVVRADQTLPVTLTAIKGDSLVHTSTTSGTGSTDINIFLGEGTYTIKAASASMEKTYTVEVTTTGNSTTSTDRRMTTPVCAASTANSVTLEEAGTRATADGRIFYGYSTDTSSDNVWTWYYIDGSEVKTSAGAATSDVTYANHQLTFTGLSGTDLYFFEKAEACSPFSESISAGLKVTLSTISSVTVSPATVTLSPGASYQFSASAGGSPHAVTWSISGATSPDTGITSAGLVHIAANENAAALTVTATSQAEPTKSGTATITVQAGATADATLSSVGIYAGSVLQQTLSSFTANVAQGHDYTATATITGLDSGTVIFIDPTASAVGSTMAVYRGIGNYDDRTTVFSSTDTTNFELLSAGTYQFTPTGSDQTHYVFVMVTASGVSKVYKLTISIPAVQKTATTVVTLPTPGTVPAGEASSKKLSDIPLNGGVGSVAGSFSWTHPDNSTFPGWHSVTFTPSDVVHYATNTTTSVLVLYTGRPLGDVNGDNEITIVDSACIGIHLLKTGGLLTEIEKIYADVNKDNVVNSTDLQLINQYLVGAVGDDFVSVVP